MELSKSEIWEMMKRLESKLSDINTYLPSVDKGWVSWHMILSSLIVSKGVLEPLKTHIIDNDDYKLALELDSMITPAWSNYCACLNDDGSMKHQDAYELEYIIDDLRKWIKKYEGAHPKQPETPTFIPLTGDGENEKKTKKHPIDQERLKGLFIDSFFSDDYDVIDTAFGKTKQSRFDKFLLHLEMVLEDSDNPVKNNDIAGVAYMIHESRFTKSKYSQPRGKYAPLLRLLFESVRMDFPSDQRKHNYIPDEETKDLFKSILDWEEQK